MSAPKVFISYSHKDEDWKDRLCLQLDVLGMEGLLSIWDDRQIIEGDDWYPEIEAALNSCDIAVMLISAHFLTSGFIRGKEVPALLQRREQEGIRVIPVIIKPCPWQKVSWLSAIQGGVKDNVVLSGLSEHEQEDKLSHLASRVDDLVAEAKSAQPKPANSTSTPAPISEKHIQVDKLPTVAGDFVGREAELQMLDDAFSHSNTKILQFIAAGGTGKTKLLRHWLDEKQQQGKIQNRIINPA